MRRIGWWVLVGLGLGLLLAACGVGPAAEAPTPTPLPTAVKPTYAVQRGELLLKTTLGGRVVPLSAEPVSFATDGAVGNVYVQVGDYVEAGQLLADLQALKDLEAQWAQASADANYETTISNNTIQRAEIKLQIALLNVEDLRAGGARATALQMAELQAQLAQMDLDEVKANPVLHTAEAKVTALEQKLIAAQLKAPLAGYIISAPSSGQAMRTTTVAFQIGDIHQLELSAMAQDEDLKQLTEGMPLTVYFDDRPTEMYAGVIRQLPYPYGTGAGSAGEVRITLSVTPEQGGYKLGDRLVVTIVLQDKKDVLWLPPPAIRNVAGRTFVLAQTASGQQRLEVTLGIQTRDRVEITGGLTEGQVVLGP